MWVVSCLPPPFIIISIPSYCTSIHPLQFVSFHWISSTMMRPSLPLVLALLSFWSSHAFSTISTKTTTTTIGTTKCRRVLPSSTTTTTALGPTARNGLSYDDIEIGQGRRILPGDTVTCYYRGTFQKKAGPFGMGKPVVFDETQEGAPFRFPVGKGQVIQGWDLGVLGKADLDIPPMYVGGLRRLKIPSGLAYGSDGAGPIPANQDLEFDIQVLDAGQEGGISLEYRLKGYAVALTIPLVLVAMAWFVLQNISL